MTHSVSPAPATPLAVPKGRRRARRVIPGFGLGMGITLFWLGLIVLVPLAGLFLKAAGLGVGGIWQIWSEPRVLANGPGRPKRMGSSTQRTVAPASASEPRPIATSRAA